MALCVSNVDDRHWPKTSKNGTNNARYLGNRARYKESHYYWLEVAYELSIGTKIIDLGGRFLGVETLTLSTMVLKPIGLLLE